jgi:hypothetical protein
VRTTGKPLENPWETLGKPLKKIEKMGIGKPPKKQRFFSCIG